MGTIASGNYYSCTTMVVVEEIMQLFNVSYSSLVLQYFVVKFHLVNEFDLVLLNLILPAQFDRKLVK